MQTKNKEWIHYVLLSLPLIVFAALYPSLADQIPTHFDGHGTPDDYTSKQAMPFVLLFETWFLYFLLRFLTRNDPKKKLSLAPELLFRFRIGVTVFMVALGLIEIAMARPGADLPLLVHLIVACAGLLLAFIGYSMSSIPQNYFIGFRTPWALESEPVWRRTHRVFGPLVALWGLGIFGTGIAGAPAKLTEVLFITLIGVFIGGYLYSWYLFRTRYAR